MNAPNFRNMNPRAFHIPLFFRTWKRKNSLANKSIYALTTSFEDKKNYSRSTIPLTLVVTGHNFRIEELFTVDRINNEHCFARNSEDQVLKRLTMALRICMHLNWSNLK